MTRFRNLTLLALLILIASASIAQDATAISAAQTALVDIEATRWAASYTLSLDETAPYTGNSTAMPDETALTVFNATRTAEGAPYETATPSPVVAPEVTQEAVAPVVVNIEMPPAASTQTTLIDEDAYIKTLDRLSALIEMLVGFIPAGAVGGLLIVVLGAAWIITRLTPTKRDDEIFDRLWAKIEEKLKG